MTLQQQKGLNIQLFAGGVVNQNHLQLINVLIAEQVNLLRWIKMITDKRNIGKELSKNIVEEVYKKLDEIYDHRKAREGLVSYHNTLINSLKRHINKWYKGQTLSTEVKQ